jgi:tetratricopeptide (TPR) repeat protein
VRRVLDHYLAQAVSHGKALPLRPGAGAPPQGDPAGAIAWFDLEYPNLIAAFDTAVRLGADEVVVELPPAMRAWFLRRRGTDEQIRMLEAAASAAERLGRTGQRAELLADLGFGHAAAGRLTEALAAYELAGQPGADDDAFTGGLALRTGFVLRDLGDYEAAQDRFRHARRLFEKTGNRGGQSQALAFDGWVTLQLGRPAEAAGLARASIALAAGSARITGLGTLGVALAPDDPQQALQALHEALDLAELPHNKAWCHNNLGIALRVMGKFDEALEHHRRALELLEPLAEAQLEIECRNALAETRRAAGLDTA